ncbi:MFS transporter [Saxibacter everestensis]|uniref:MFS transporter n=1 Tax=Saxibacter everestensis TaxID=2909229 RepID=A0ABY8QWZ2_9MICO|nr:MFS transporter [Brevibacteriaceae bacterium ZFBP1038]
MPETHSQNPQNQTLKIYSLWAVGVFAYLIAVLQRTSLGVAGLEATERFHASASVLSMFTVIQLLVYAGLQIPVGVLVDRWGPKILVAAGAALMALGQAVLAFAPEVLWAIVGRLFVGAGDAFTFIAVLRLVVAWFPPSRVPVFTQLTGLVGQLGQILSAVPFVWLLHTAGWTTAFLSAAALSALAVIIAVAVLRMPADAVPSGPAQTVREVWHSVVATWRHPGTQLGLWTHFTTPFSGTMFVLLWGVPFLVSGQGMSTAMASGLLSLYAVSALAAGPITGRLVARHPLRRSWLVLAIVFATMAAWAAVLLWPGRAPFWLIVIMLLVLSVSGPGSMIAFDFARTFNPPSRQGTASGVVNVGGFIAALVAMYLIGLLLDLSQRAWGGDLYQLSHFKLALSVQFLLFGIGVWGIISSRAKARAEMAAMGVRVPPIMEALRRELAAGRQRRQNRRS